MRLKLYILISLSIFTVACSQRALRDTPDSLGDYPNASSSSQTNDAVEFDMSTTKEFSFANGEYKLHLPAKWKKSQGADGTIFCDGECGPNLENSHFVLFVWGEQGCNTKWIAHSVDTSLVEGEVQQAVKSIQLLSTSGGISSYTWLSPGRTDRSWCVGAAHMPLMFEIGASEKQTEVTAFIESQVLPQLESQLH